MNNNSTLSEFGDEDFQIELIETFIAESQEHLDMFENSLLSIEKSFDIEDNVFKAMRAAHSLKGSASMLGFTEISNFAHKVEDLLSYIRESKASINQDIIDILYSSKDVLSSMILSLKENSKNTYEKEIKTIEAEIEDILKNPQEIEKTKPKINEIKNPKNEIKDTTKTIINETIRVNVNKINSLINFSTETNITYLKLFNTIKDKLTIDEQYMFDELHKMIIGIQEESIRVRMRELDVVLSKFKRIVRDLARSKNKEVVLAIEGGDIELDKTVLEKIEDPLKHMIRNSIDHGIEYPEEREKLGKPREGVISLKAYYFNGQVRIIISDDGRGLDKDKILKKAKEKSIIKDDSKLSDEEIYNLIFIPGFSTSDEVTDISGRGVGMDVVNKNISAIYGSIKIKSEKGKGTDFIIDIPLTLSIMDGVYVKIKSNIFAISNKDAEEFVLIDDVKKMKSNRLEDTILYKGEILPVFDLAEYLNVENRRNTYKFIAVINTDKKFGIYIDEPLGSDQMIIKSVEKNYKRVNGILGTTIYKDGTLAPILDMRIIIKFLFENQKG